MDSHAYFKATKASDQRLRDRTRDIIAAQDAGTITSREAADLRVDALTAHLDACREARLRYLEDRPAVIGRRLCAQADADGQGMHWLESGDTCPATAEVAGVSGVHVGRVVAGLVNPLTAPVAIFAGARDAVVVVWFADGSYWTRKVTGRNAIAMAQREATELSLMGSRRVRVNR
jgi:hypothetical protein